MPRRKKIAAATGRGVTGESGMFQVRGRERLQERQKGTPAPHPTLVCVLGPGPGSRGLQVNPRSEWLTWF